MDNHKTTWDELRKVHPWLPSSSEGWHQHDNGGGWVQDTASVSGEAQVYGEARVCDKALVYGKAQVYGEARVCDKAQVYGEARVCDKARVYGEALVSPLYIQGTRYWMCWSGGDLVSSGCITKPLAWWLEHVERCAEKNGYTTDQQAEYRLHVEHIAAWMRLYKLDQTETPATK